MNDTYCENNGNESTLKEEEQQKKVFLSERIAFLEKCSIILFWMVVPALLGEIFTFALIVQFVPTQFVAGPVLQFVCSLVYGIVLLRLSSVERKYCVSGILNIVRAFFFVIAIIYSLIGAWDSIVIVFLCLCFCLIIRYIGYYFEFTGHSYVLRDMDNELSKDWTSLKKWMIRFLVAILCILGLFWIRGFLEKEFPMFFYQGYAQYESFIARIFAMMDFALYPSLILVLAAVTAGLAGISILKYVYLSKNIRDFKSYRKDPIGFDPSKRRKDRQE